MVNIVVDQANQLVRATFTGAVALPDLATHVRTLIAMSVLAMPMLIDAREAMSVLSDGDLEDVSSLMTTLRKVYGRAPVAVVVGDDYSRRIAEQYGELGAGDNPGFRIFDDIAAAEAWLKKPT